MTAPATAPITVAIAALLTTSSPPVFPPICREANSRQAASSTMNWSKTLPEPGKAITEGAVGTVAHAESRRSGKRVAAKEVAFIGLLVCCLRLWRHCLPGGWALLNIWVIGLGRVTVIPEPGRQPGAGRHRRRLLDIDSRRRRRKNNDTGRIIRVGRIKRWHDMPSVGETEINPDTRPMPMISPCRLAGHHGKQREQENEMLHHDLTRRIWPHDRRKQV